MNLLISSICFILCHLLDRVSLENPNQYREISLQRNSLSKNNLNSERYLDGRIDVRKYFDEGSGTRPVVDHQAGNPKKADGEFDFDFLLQDSETQRGGKKKKQKFLDNRPTSGVKQRWVAAFKRLYTWLVQYAQKLKGRQEHRDKTHGFWRTRLKKKGRQSDGKKRGQKGSSKVSEDSSNSGVHSGADAPPLISDEFSTSVDQKSFADAEQKLQSDENWIGNEQKVPSDQETRKYESAVSDLLKVPPEMSDAVFKFINLGFKVMQKNIPVDKALKKIIPGNWLDRLVRAGIHKRLDPIIERSCDTLDLEREDIPERFQKYRNFHEIIRDRNQFPNFEKEVYFPLVTSIRDMVKIAFNLNWGPYKENEIVGRVAEYLKSLEEEK